MLSKKIEYQILHFILHNNLFDIKPFFFGALLSCPDMSYIFQFPSDRYCHDILPFYISPLENTVLTNLTSVHSNLIGTVISYHPIQFPSRRYYPDIYDIIQFQLGQVLSDYLIQFPAGTLCPDISYLILFLSWHIT